MNDAALTRYREIAKRLGYSRVSPPTPRERDSLRTWVAGRVAVVGTGRLRAAVAKARNAADLAGVVTDLKIKRQGGLPQRFRMLRDAEELWDCLLSPEEILKDFRVGPGATITGLPLDDLDQRPAAHLLVSPMLLSEAGFGPRTPVGAVEAASRKSAADPNSKELLSAVEELRTELRFLTTYLTTQDRWPYSMEERTYSLVGGASGVFPERWLDLPLELVDCPGRARVQRALEKRRSEAIETLGDLPSRKQEWEVVGLRALDMAEFSAALFKLCCNWRTHVSAVATDAVTTPTDAETAARADVAQGLSELAALFDES